MATQKAVKATTRTRAVPAEQVPAELRNLYKDEAVEEAAASLKFSTTDDPNAEPVEMETLFWVDDTEYKIPKEFGPSIALMYLDVIDKGRDMALALIMRGVIGPEGWSALMDLAAKKKINMAQVKALMEVVNTKTMGAMEAMEGNS
jgi:hypothetical protein